MKIIDQAGTPSRGDELQIAVLADIALELDAMRALRRDIHAHPELGFEEVRTADRVALKLAEWGIPMHRGLGKTGVVGVIKAGGRGGRSA